MLILTRRCKAVPSQSEELSQLDQVKILPHRAGLFDMRKGRAPARPLIPPAFLIGDKVGLQADRGQRQAVAGPKRPRPDFGMGQKCPADPPDCRKGGTASIARCAPVSIWTEPTSLGAWQRRMRCVRSTRMVRTSARVVRSPACRWVSGVRTCAASGPDRQHSPDRLPPRHPQRSRHKRQGARSAPL